MAVSQVCAVKASDGSEYSSVPPNVKGSGAGGNGGSVTRAGTVNSGLLDNVEVSRFDEGVFGSTVVEDVNAVKSLSAGVFAGNNDEFIAKRLTDVLAGSVDNDILLSGAAVPENVRSIHKLEVLRTRRFTTAIRENRYNKYTGKWENGYPVVAVDTLARDNAANPTRSAPGSLTYRTSAPLAKNDTYKVKNG